MSLAGRSRVAAPDWPAGGARFDLLGGRRALRSSGGALWALQGMREGDGELLGKGGSSGEGFLGCAVTGTGTGGLCSILLQIRGFYGLRVPAKHAFHNYKCFPISPNAYVCVNGAVCM